MFTGIIENTGKVTSLKRGTDKLELWIETGFVSLALGESVAVNGACLTVTECTPQGDAQFFVSIESLRKTSLGELQKGSKVNLERALQMGARLSGHWVQGHVDGLAKILRITPEAESYKLEVLLPSSLAKYCVEKGSITLDGVSLTVNSVRDLPSRESEISIQLIPHTWNHTTFSDSQAGQSLNVEVDILAKYLERFSQLGYKAGTTDIGKE